MSAPGRLRSIGWGVTLLACIAVFAGLTFKVNAVKNEVRLAERQIVALEREKMLLETEFQTRSNQRQLANWNEVEFGFAAPRADQFLENERQLAELGVPRSPDAPEPIRVASAPRADDEDLPFPKMVSPVTGQPVGQEAGESGNARDRLMAAAAAEMKPGEHGSLPLNAVRTANRIAQGPIRIPIGNARIAGGEE